MMVDKDINMDFTPLDGEPWVRYKLSNGTVLSFRCIVKKIRLDPNNPGEYLVSATTMARVAKEGLSPYK